MKDSICQHCFNFDCSWHNEFKPVEGWSAIPTHLHEIGDSYCVLKCPLYTARRNNLILTNTHELSQLCGFSWRTFMRKLSRDFKTIERLLFDKGFVLKIEKEDGAVNNRYYLQRELTFSEHKSD